MRYEDIRGQIETGDLIAVKRRTGPLAVATRLVTASPYTHTGIAQWVGLEGDRRLLLAQINGGGSNLVPLSQMAVYAFDAFRCPVDRQAVERAMWKTLGDKMGYSVGDLVRLAAYIRLGVPLPPQGDDYICSALSAYLYRLAGWQPRNLPSIPWPGAVVDALESPPFLQYLP